MNFGNVIAPAEGREQRHFVQVRLWFQIIGRFPALMRSDTRWPAGDR